MTGEQEPLSSAPVTEPAVFSNEPPLWVYVVGFGVGFATAFAFGSHQLTPGQATIAGVIGGVAALLGVGSIENLGEGCFTLLIFCPIIWWGRTAPWCLLSIVPLFIGLSFGKIWVGLWKEIRVR